MKRKIKVLILIILALLIAFAVVKIGTNDDAPPQAENDEIKVNIRLDLDEDIGLLLFSYDVNGTEGSGGVSNADQSMLKKDSKDLYWSFYKEELETAADTVDMKLSFTVVTEYFEPNYDNNYPKEYMIPMDAFLLQVNFGETYYVTIKGSKANGYHAGAVFPL